MRAILIGPAVAARDLPWLKRALKRQGVRNGDLRIAVDGGLDVCRRVGLKPSIAVGDWDSLRSRRALQGLTHFTLDRRKDWSDLAAALEAALELGASEIVCFGFTGGKADHHLAALLELSASSARAPATAIGPEGEYRFLSTASPVCRGRARKGTPVSVFALGAPALGVTLTGLEYGLRSARLDPGSRGLSNRVRGSEFGVTLKRGRLLVFVADRA